MTSSSELYVYDYRTDERLTCNMGNNKFDKLYMYIVAEPGTSTSLSLVDMYIYSHQCHICPSGMYINENAHNEPEITNYCIDCPLGTYGSGGECIVCLHGQFVDKKGQFLASLVTPVLVFQNRTSCAYCPIGKYHTPGNSSDILTLDQLNCTVCPAGYHGAHSNENVLYRSYWYSSSNNYEKNA